MRSRNAASRGGQPQWPSSTSAPSTRPRRRPTSPAASRRVQWRSSKAAFEQTGLPCDHARPRMAARPGLRRSAGVGRATGGVRPRRRLARRRRSSSDRRSSGRRTRWRATATSIAAAPTSVVTRSPTRRAADALDQRPEREHDRQRGEVEAQHPAPESGRRPELHHRRQPRQDADVAAADEHDGDDGRPAPMAPACRGSRASGVATSTSTSIRRRPNRSTMRREQQRERHRADALSGGHRAGRRRQRRLRSVSSSANAADQRDERRRRARRRRRSAACRCAARRAPHDRGAVAQVGEQPAVVVAPSPATAAGRAGRRRSRRGSDAALAKNAAA